MITFHKFDLLRSCLYSIDMFKPLLKLLWVAFLPILFFGCASVNSENRSAAPPIDPSGIVEIGDAAAELLVEPEVLEPGKKAVIRIANKGKTALQYGRPIMVEEWTGTDWRETETSKNTIWTMELLHLQRGETGAEQIWPFSSTPPNPGWYRFSKLVHPQIEAPEPMIIRTRIKVE